MRLHAWHFLIDRQGALDDLRMPLFDHRHASFYGRAKASPLWSCCACILEATRQMSDVNHTEVQRPARHTQHSRVGAVGEAADLPLKGSRKGEIGCRFGFSPTTNAGTQGDEARRKPVAIALVASSRFVAL
jgi:hypothetical protein